MATFTAAWRPHEVGRVPAASLLDLNLVWKSDVDLTRVIPIGNLGRFPPLDLLPPAGHAESMGLAEGPRHTSAPI